MSNINRHSFSQFSVPAVTSEEVGWRSRLSKWQWALVIGVPLAAAAALAGVALVVGVRRRRRSLSEPESPQPSLSPTPVASPTATAAKKPGGSEKPGEKPGEKAKVSCAPIGATWGVCSVCKRLTNASQTQHSTQHPQPFLL